jgi:hypothetical protein
MSIHNPKRERGYFPYFTYLLREGKLRRSNPKRREDLIQYYKSKNPEDYEMYVKWCKDMESLTGKKKFY